MLGEFNKFDKIRFTCIAVGLCIFIPSVVLFILDRINNIENYSKYWQIGIALLLVTCGIYWITGYFEKNSSKPELNNHSKKVLITQIGNKQKLSNN